MNFDKENMQSVRYMPAWNRNSGTGIAGLIGLCFDIYHLNPNASRWVEIGSYIGESALIFAAFPYVKRLDCVDPLVIGSKIKDKEQRFKERLIFFKSKVTFHKTTSEIYSKEVEDNSLDVVYIDGDHKYPSVINDLDLWYPKIKNGGFLCGHDYSKRPNHRHSGVTKAVDEFVDFHGLEIFKTYCDTSFLIRI
jgi:cephalosporin hydroxylase